MADIGHEIAAFLVGIADRGGVAKTQHDSAIRRRDRHIPKCVSRAVIVGVVDLAAFVRFKTAGDRGKHRRLAQRDFMRPASQIGRQQRHSQPVHCADPPIAANDNDRNR